MDSVNTAVREQAGVEVEEGLPMNVLVLGIGNILLSDEGAGVKAVEEFCKRYVIPAGVEVVDGGTMGLELLSYLDDRTHLIIVDAVKSGCAPGTPTRQYLDDPPAYFRTKISPHQIGLSELLAVAAISDGLPRNIILIGIEPEKFETSMEMSEAVSRNFGALVDLVAVELREFGFSIKHSA